MRFRRQIAIASGLGLLALSLLFVGRARAQDAPQSDQPPAQQEDAPPPPQQQAPPSAGPQQPIPPQQQVAMDAPGVARVSFIRGEVSMQRGDSGETSDTTINTPLEAGDKVLTGPGARTELELDAADILRLDHDGEATIATLTANRVQVQVGQGLASYSVMKGGSADVEIDTPNVAVHPLREGRYRVQVDPDGTTQVIVRDGEADVSTPQGSTKIRTGDLITIRGIGDTAEYKVTPAPGADDFDNWNRERDGIIYNAHASQNTNHNYTGASDLDSYGVWDEAPDYGQVWVPAVDTDWAPYRQGQWAYEPYWGWTWVSYEPWGWAPYHYGRWFMYGNRWAWWPGPVYGGYPPVWAPAYVSFFGFGAGAGVNFGFGFGFGSIGWLAIGPGDYFHPWWGGYRDRFAVADFNHFGNLHEGFAPLRGGGFSNLHDVMVNDRMRAGLSGVAAGSFGHAGAIARGVSAEDFRGARAMMGNVPVVPGRDSLRTSNRAVSASMSARAGQQEHFYSRMTPASRPESFSQASARTQSALQRNNIQYHANAEAGGGARSFSGGNAGYRGNAGASYRPPQQGAGGQGQFGRGQGEVGANASARPQGADGWNRFGGSGGSSDIRSGRAPNSYVGQGQSGGGSRGESEERTYRPQEGGGQSQIYRGSSPRSYEGQGRQTARPQLSMNQPIVTQRSPRESGPSETNRGGGYSGGNPGNYSGNYGGRSSSAGPSYRSSAPSPAYRSAPSGGGNRVGGGSAPRGGGGGSRGGSSGGHRR